MSIITITWLMYRWHSYLFEWKQINDDTPFGNISSDASFLHNLSASDFPISIRSCSESNLLFDALQTITSTSPKQICNANGDTILGNPYKLAHPPTKANSPTFQPNNTGSQMNPAAEQSQLQTSRDG